jgi:hypothetical protein
MATFKNLAKLNASTRSDVEAYCGEILGTLGERVRAISVYGSAAGPDFIPKRSNVNLVVVLERLGTDSLEPLLAIVKAGLRKRIVPPLLVSPDYLAGARDVFPIELLEIRDSHVVIYGEDLFEGLEVSRDHLRLECESQLRAAALRTRQAYLEMGLARRGPERVLHASVTSLIPVFRAMLRLKGASVPRSKLEVVEALASAFGVDTAVFAAVLRDKAGDERIEGSDSHRVLARVVDAIEAVTACLDQA